MTKRALAQRALEMYDQGDDEGFLDFLVEQRSQDQAREPLLRADWEEGEFLLEDGSMVAINEVHGARFNWNEGMVTRECRIPLAQTPPYPGTQRKMLDWPNGKAVLQRVLQLMERKARRQKDPEGKTDDVQGEELLSEREAVTAVPGLNQIITRYIQDEYNLPEELLQELDREVSHSADMVIRRMTPEETAKLEEAIALKMDLEE